MSWADRGALGMVARTTYPIEQARVLLELGASIDHPRPFSKGYTALQWACNASSKDAAHLVKFLLFEGADPEHVRLKRGQEVRFIETWLGMTWSELVKWAAKEGKREQRVRDERMVG